jgi:uncharacterized protein YegL
MTSWFDDPSLSNSEPAWSASTDGSESYPVLPICITIDTSGSMGEVMGVLNACLPDLKDAMRQDLTAGEMARIAIVTFNTTAYEALPMSDLDMVSMPVLQAQGVTNYAAAFKATRDVFERAIPQLGKGVRYYAPIAFLLTDGEPSDSESAWMPELQHLKNQGKYRANVVCFGFGDANQDVLRRIGLTFMARDADPVTSVKAVFRELIGSIKTTSGSVREAVETGGSGRLEFTANIRDDFIPFLPLDLSSP